MIEIALLTGPCLFAIGLFGFLTRRNLILIFLSLELMLAGVSLNFITFGYLHGDLGGQVLAIFVLVVAACEAALALSLIVALVRAQGTLDVSRWSVLREPAEPTGPHEELDDRARLAAKQQADQDETEDEGYPKLTPAGLAPRLRPIDPDFKLPEEASKA